MTLMEPLQQTYKRIDFNEIDEMFIQDIASKRNNIPKKLLN